MGWTRSGFHSCLKGSMSFLSDGIASKPHRSGHSARTSRSHHRQWCDAFLVSDLNMFCISFLSFALWASFMLSMFSPVRCLCQCTPGLGCSGNDEKMVPGLGAILLNVTI